MRLDEKECFWIKSSFRMYVFFVFKEKLGCHSVVNLYRTELRFFFFSNVFEYSCVVSLQYL